MFGIVLLQGLVEALCLPCWEGFQAFCAGMAGIIYGCCGGMVGCCEGCASGFAMSLQWCMGWLDTCLQTCCFFL